MFNRTDAKTIGTRIGAQVVFHKGELARTDDRYVREVVRRSAAGVLDEIVGKYAKHVEANRGELLGVEYSLEVWVLTRDEMNALFAQAYNAGAHDGARHGYAFVPPDRTPDTGDSHE